MNISVAIINGVLKLAQLVTNEKGTNKRVRIYDPKSTVPESILHESTQRPGVFVDEVNDKLYHQCNGRWVGI